MAGCPPVDQLRGFTSGVLSDELAAAIGTHLGSCASCRTSMVDLARGSNHGAPPVDAEARLGTVLGRYRIERVLGMGGMGIVYAAHDPQLDRPVAIKLVHRAAADAAGKARLVREAQSLARLSHPNVCHVYDVGTDPEGDVWVAMELVDGSTLRAWADGKPHAELLAALTGVAEGIAAAHAAGLIHRDIKPENVLVTREGRPVVTDFGLARLDAPIDPEGSTAAIDPLRTATNAIVGTPAYLAPEQLTGGTLDARVDQFAWAVMAWELLSGVRPFPAVPLARLDAILRGAPPHPSLPRPLAAVLGKAMAASPRDRYASMRELLHALAARPAPSRKTLAVSIGAVALAGIATLATWKLVASDEAAPAIVVEPPRPAIAVELPVEPKPAEPAKPPEPPPAKPALAVAKPPAQPRPERRSPPATAPGELEAYLARYPYDKTRAVAVLDAFCRIPIDPAKPGPEPGRHGVADWGKVTRRELGLLKLGNRPFKAPLYEVKGHRGTYRFTADHWENTIGVMDAKVGQWVVLCVDQMSELYELPAGWQNPLATLAAMVPVSRPPRVDELAPWNPLHISELALRRDGGYGTTSLDVGRRYLLRSKPEAHEGGIRWDMSSWWMDVPSTIPGANLVAAGKRLWFVVEGLTFEDQPDGSKPRLVVRAVAVVDDLFP